MNPYDLNDVAKMIRKTAFRGGNKLEQEVVLTEVLYRMKVGERFALSSPNGTIYFERVDARRKEEK